MTVIPALDIIDGRLVRLAMGDYLKKTEYSSTPLDMAKRFEDAGLKHIHLVDLDAAKSGELKNLKILEEIAKKTKLSIDFGGGVKTEQNLKSVLNAGAAEVSVGSVAVKNPSLVYSWIEKYENKLILSADSLNGFISISGWQQNTDLDVISFIKSYNEKGLKKVIATDISRDGMLSGPSLGLYTKLLNSLPDEFVIASGGISSYSDLIALKEIGIKSAIVGKAYYEGRISLEELKEAENAC